MLGDTEETHTECPHCKNKVKIRQFLYDNGGVGTPTLEKVDD